MSETAPETLGLRERLADRIGEMPEAQNVFDIADEAITWINALVEAIADALLPVVAQEIAAAEQRGREEVRARVGAIHGGTHWCHNADEQPDVFEPDTVWWPCPTLAALAEPAAEEGSDWKTLTEQGRRLASRREDLIAQGGDPALLDIPLAPREDRP